MGSSGRDPETRLSVSTVLSSDFTSFANSTSPSVNSAPHIMPSYIFRRLRILFTISLTNSPGAQPLCIYSVVPKQKLIKEPLFL